MIGLLALLKPAAAQTQEQNMQADLSEVTVFLQGAQLQMRADAQLQAGSSILKISKLPPTLDPNSVQVKGDGSFTIQSVNFRVNYLDSLEESKEREDLVRRLEEVNRKIQDHKNQSDIIVAKDVFLRENRVVGGKDSPLSPEAYRQLYELYCRFVEAEKNEWFDLMKKIAALEKESQKLQQQLNERPANRQSKTAGEVLVTVNAKSPCQAKFRLSFMVNDARWVPSYDLRVAQVGEPVTLVYKANVVQTTRMDWKHVKLTLSNATPYQSGIVPVLSPYYVNYKQVSRPVGTRDAGAAPAMMEVAGTREKKAMVNMDDFVESAMPLQVYTHENQTNVEFKIDASYTVTGDGKAQTIDVQRIELPAEYLYKAVPKKERDAFLVARVTDWEKHNLLPGESNLYFENTFIGKSVLDPGQISDTLELSLGRDRSVVLSRTRVKGYSQKQFMGGNRIENRHWEIAVRNNKNRAVKLQISDQVPVTSRQEISVEVEEISGGQWNKDNGLITWDLQLEPKENRKLNLKYSVKFPKDKVVVVE